MRFLLPGQAHNEIKVHEGGGRIAVGINAGKIARERVHLLAEFRVSADRFTPLPHHLRLFLLLAVVTHPARGTERSERLRCSAPTVARDGTDEGGIILGNGSERIGCPECFGIVDLTAPDSVEDRLVLRV